MMMTPTTTMIVAMCSNKIVENFGSVWCTLLSFGAVMVGWLSFNNDDKKKQQKKRFSTKVNLILFENANENPIQ